MRVSMCVCTHMIMCVFVGLCEGIECDDDDDDDDDDDGHEYKMPFDFTRRCAEYLCVCSVFEHVYIHIYIYVCMYVCMYVCISSQNHRDKRLDIQYLSQIAGATTVLLQHIKAQ
jgi:hypothetical protein